MLTEKQKNIIINAFMPFKPNRIGVFGSYAKNEGTKDSDIDILFEVDAKITLFTIGGIYMDLKEKLKTDVDLVEFSAIHPLLKDEILSEVKVFYDAKSKFKKLLLI